jgi:hypothetical protein
LTFGERDSRAVESAATPDAIYSMNVLFPKKPLLP